MQYRQENVVSEKSGFRPFAGLVIIFTLLISPLIYVEFFVDPYPNSIWALRILNTKYIVHARAELEIDGETLVLERPIRCFDAVDYDYYPSSSPRGDVLGSNSATADTLAGKTSKGRLFALNVKGACAVLRRKMRNNDDLFFKHQNLGDYEYLEPVYLSRGDLDTPIVYELFGEKKALKQVDIYYSRTLLREGYHGVKIKELVIWREPMRVVHQGQGYRGAKLNEEAKVTLKPLGPMYKDWTEYDWFGEPSWYRRTKGNDGLFFGFYGFKFAPSSFDEVVANYYKFNGDDNVMEGTIEHNLAKYASDRKQQIFYLLAFSDFHLTVINRFGLDFFSRDLTPSLHHPLESQMHYQPFVDSFFQCLIASGTIIKIKEMICTPEKNGVASFWPYSLDRVSGRRMPFIVDGKKFQVKDDNLNYHYDVTNNTVYAVEYSEQRFW
jgi:hypothetical protein